MMPKRCQTEALQIGKTMVFVQEGLQFSLFPRMPKIDPKSHQKALKMRPKMRKKTIWEHIKKTPQKRLQK